jgi:hypothetical protein
MTLELGSEHHEGAPHHANHTVWMTTRAAAVHLAEPSFEPGTIERSPRGQGLELAGKCRQPEYARATLPGRLRGKVPGYPCSLNEPARVAGQHGEKTRSRSCSELSQPGVGEGPLDRFVVADPATEIASEQQRLRFADGTAPFPEHFRYTGTDRHLVNTGPVHGTKQRHEHRTGLGIGTNFAVPARAVSRDEGEMGERLDVLNERRATVQSAFREPRWRSGRSGDATF